MIAARRARQDIAQLLTVIIENSTMMPFRWCGNKYMCFFCCCVFQEVTHLRDHTHTEHENPKLLNVLKQTQATSNRLKLDVSNVTCKVCPKALSNLEEFLDHAFTAHDLKVNKEASKSFFCVKLRDDVLQCLDCEERFKFFGTLLAHGYKFHNKSAFLCEVCGQGFVSRAHAASHQHYFHSEVNCETCSKSFKTRYLLKMHMDRVHKTFQCSKCPQVFGSRYMRKRHIAIDHDVKSIQFKCNDCDKVFISKNRLVVHTERTHLKLKPIVCPICGLSVFNKASLKRHMVKHDDARPFECDICKKTFQRKKTLVYHRRIHTNDRRHACKTCGKAFVQVASLKLHMRVHHPSSERVDWN